MRVRLRAAAPTQHGSQLLAHSCHRWQILSRCHLGGRSTGVVLIGSDDGHFMPEKPIELTIFFAKTKNRISMGSAATRTAAISPAQSGLPAESVTRNTPSATVSTRTSVVVADQQRPEVVVPLGDEGEDGQRGDRRRSSSAG